MIACGSGTPGYTPGMPVPFALMACRIETTNLRHDRHRGSNFCPVHALLRVVSCMEWLIDGLLFPRRERCHRRCNAVTPGAGIAVRQRFVPVQARTSGAPNDRRVRIIGINFCPGHDALRCNVAIARIGKRLFRVRFRRDSNHAWQGSDQLPRVPAISGRARRPPVGVRTGHRRAWVSAHARVLSRLLASSLDSYRTVTHTFFPRRAVQPPRVSGSTRSVAPSLSGGHAGTGMPAEWDTEC